MQTSNPPKPKNYKDFTPRNSHDFKNVPIYLSVMITPPWHTLKLFKEIPDGRLLQFVTWLWGWLISLAGIIGVGVYAPYIVSQLMWPVVQTHQAIAILSIALAGGIFWQVSYYLLPIPFYLIIGKPLIFLSSVILSKFNNVIIRFIIIFVSIFSIVVIAIFPFLITIYLVYDYTKKFAPSHNLVGKGIISAALINLFETFIFWPIVTFFISVLRKKLFTKIRGEEI